MYASESTEHRLTSVKEQLFLIVGRSKDAINISMEFQMNGVVNEESLNKDMHKLMTVFLQPVELLTSFLLTLDGTQLRLYG